MREAESASGKNSAAATATDSKRTNLGDSTAHKSEWVMARAGQARTVRARCTAAGEWFLVVW